jgi:hypothetical protein
MGRLRLPAASVAAESLRRRVIHHLHRPFEHRFEVEADPTRAEVVRFGHRFVVGAPALGNLRLPDHGSNPSPAPSHD